MELLRFPQMELPQIQSETTMTQHRHSGFWLGIPHFEARIWRVEIYHPSLVPFHPFPEPFSVPGCTLDMRQRQPSRPTCTMSHSKHQGMAKYMGFERFKQQEIGISYDFMRIWIGFGEGQLYTSSFLVWKCGYIYIYIYMYMLHIYIYIYYTY